MARYYHLIDGYNLMHAAGIARVRYARGDLERCRNRLLLRVSELLTEDERQRATVVFDAREAPPGSIRRHIYRGMNVEFAEPGTEADDHIEILISNHSASRQLLLVSSDHRLQRAVKRRHGRSIDSEEFLRVYTQRELMREHEPHADDQSPPATISQQKDLEFWLDEFENVDPRQILRELPKEISESRFLPPEEKSGATGTATPANCEIDPAHERTRWEQEVDELQDLLDDPQRVKNWIDDPDFRQH
ncbi:YacP-like NYN domain protein [Planctopirus ephydatiae]|uniref:YacP-like NYN domain protein n=1 Tax=Planctopirus ephydatiae TaxID=2528019 RepID=A0A518GR95_9PLAN|nr:NYN domain-containing protein [Planctopirus ephydatiae]QDV31110.1 YacP-like NYN domain protein [Planctopirus ephydatiae]